MKNPFEKPYSRLDYDEQARETQELQEMAQNNPGHEVIRTKYVEPVPGQPGRHIRSVEWEKSRVTRRFEKAQSKLGKMKEKGQKEAFELEAEHKQLVQAVVDAEHALYEFEKDKLDMHKEGVEEAI